MNWKQFSTSTKLKASFGFMAVLIGLAGWQGIASLAKLNQEVSVLYKVHAQGLASLKTAQIDLHSTIFELQRATTLKDPAQLAARAEVIQTRRNSFEKQMTEFQNTAVLENSRKVANEVLNQFQTVNAEQDAVVSALLSKSPENARKALAEVENHCEKIMAQLTDLERTKHKVMEEAAEKARETYSSARNVLFLVVIVAISMSFGFGLFLTRQITKPLHNTVEVLQAVAQGDFTRHMSTDSEDEIGKMAQALNQAISGVRVALEEVNSSAVHVSEAAKELAKSSDQLSRGVHDQAASLDESAASLEQMTSTVRQNAENARQAAKQAQSARDNAENGGQVVTEAVAAMSEINLASKRIADIITTIDEIAFQTNLLALNAAVEAARAGEQGRGFAVVAAEVRNLAQRSATAAREIKNLIQDSLHKVDNGSALVNRSGKTLQEIVTSVKRVTDIVAEIAAATEEQATGIDQVNRAVVQMDKITQGNAANTERLTSTAQSLSSNAHHLRQLVGRFRLGNSMGGSAAGPASAFGTPTPDLSHTHLTDLSNPSRSFEKRPVAEADAQEMEFVDFN